MYQQLAFEAGYYRPKGYTKKKAKEKFILHLRSRGHTLDEAERMWNYEETKDKRVDLRKISKNKIYRGLQPFYAPKRDPLNIEFHEYIYNKTMNRNETYNHFIDRMYSRYMNEIIARRASKVPIPKLLGWEESLLRRKYAAQK